MRREEATRRARGRRPQRAAREVRLGVGAEARVGEAVLRRARESSRERRSRRRGVRPFSVKKWRDVTMAAEGAGGRPVGLAYRFPTI